MSGLNITPNAAKTIESLRHLTYTNVSALADIVDNSLDAGASSVRIKIDTTNKEVLIVDDGCGMPLDVMQEAIKLGSKTTKDHTNLGRFGMGLVTAGISIARKIEVFSKEAGKELNRVCLDLDYIAEKDEWIAEDDKAPSEKDKKAFDGVASGTAVRLSNADHLVHNVVGSTKHEFARIFRKFLETGVSITINGEDISPEDPLELWRNETNVLLDDVIEHNGKQVNVKLVYLDPLCSAAESNNRGYSIGKQGFYILRNNREIDQASTLGIYNRHQQYNHMRAEVSYSSNLDDDFGINFTKNRICMSQSLADKIGALVKPYLNLIKKSDEKKRAVEKSEEINHSESEEIIARKNILLRSTGVKERRHKHITPEETPEAEEEEKDDENKKSRNRIHFKEVQPAKRGIKAKIIEADLGDSALYDYRLEDGELVIRWNINHPFHKQIVARFSSDRNILTPIDFFVYSMVLAELTFDNEEAALMLDQVRSAMSSNLKVLMQ